MFLEDLEDINEEQLEEMANKLEPDLKYLIIKDLEKDQLILI